MKVLKNRGTPIILAVFFLLSYMVLLDVKNDMETFHLSIYDIIKKHPFAVVLEVLAALAFAAFIAGVVRWIIIHDFNSMKWFFILFLITIDTSIVIVSFPMFFEGVASKNRSLMIQAFTDLYPTKFLYFLLGINVLLLIITLSCDAMIKFEKRGSKDD